MKIKGRPAINLLWLRRDLRLNDNIALWHAGKDGFPVLIVFIFDTDIIEKLDKNDARITFIYHQLCLINKILQKQHSALCIKIGKPIEVMQELISGYNVRAVYANEDYEPYGIHRDKQLNDLCIDKGIGFNLYKDHVIFSRDEVVKDDGTPYTVFTPYKNKWIKKIQDIQLAERNWDKINYYRASFNWATFKSIGFYESPIQVRKYDLSRISDYHLNRDIPAKDGTSLLGPHLRFGTISIRNLVNKAMETSEVFLSELIWREFFMQILFHFPYVVNGSFRKKYDYIHWKNNQNDFEKWCNGQTGYPMVDAGMRELNTTGYMHNRVRMITASFLCKQLLVDWRWGEAYFAHKLLDYELSSNNGNWQWAAGTGCDAAPYFRVFNPTIQQQKFDADFIYIKKWIPEFGTDQYPKPLVEHSFARKRAIETYKQGLDY